MHSATKVLLNPMHRFLYVYLLNSKWLITSFSWVDCVERRNSFLSFFFGEQLSASSLHVSNITAHSFHC